MLALKTERKELAFGQAPAFCRYELHMERYRSAAEFLLRHTADARAASQRMSLIDVGAGTGSMRYFLPESDFEFHGTDIWPARIKICESLGYKMHHHDIDDEELPYTADTFDVAVASHVLEHLYHPQRAMRRIWRVLKPGGLMIVGLPMHPRWLSALCNLKHRFFPEPKGGHQWFFARHSLEAFFEGYNVLDVRGFRILSARRRANWENSHRFYRFNTWVGRRFPYLTPEVNVVVQKSE